MANTISVFTNALALSNVWLLGKQEAIDPIRLVSGLLVTR
jgi:hypothetical protein